MVRMLAMALAVRAQVKVLASNTLVAETDHSAVAAVAHHAAVQGRVGRVGR